VTSTRRRVAFLGFDGVQALDLIGPADAFTSDVFLGRRLNGEIQEHWPPYEVTIIGLTGRHFTTSGGVVMRADVRADARLRIDTLIVPGGTGIRMPAVMARAAECVRRLASTTRRVASVCTGIYGVASTGLLDNRRATTHWASVHDVSRRFPAVRVDADALFTRDGKFYTSAGVTAGIDLALCLIEEDEGAPAALAVARELVVYLKRPGGQNRFSEPLAYQVQAADRFGDLAAWIHSHLKSDLSVARLAERACLSPRQFARAFKRAMGSTPGAFVEATRVGEAKRRLDESSSRVPLAAIAHSVGYASEDVFRRAFERHAAVSPRAYRARFKSRGQE
jgi:transcriptional regulator GlxA family with amidase domain